MALNLSEPLEINRPAKGSGTRDSAERRQYGSNVSV